ncbi:MAG: serine acetyltransferase [Clostridia bacterium]|nr:serine acetyltransferase [Clostridia bacterium]MBQ8862160.1 serine acetyltransferase [Clostridia bacterium]
MNEFIKSAAEKMTANYMECDFFPRQDKVLPDERSIEKIIHDARSVIFPGYFGDESLSETVTGVFEEGTLIKIYSALKKQIKLALLYKCKCNDTEEAEKLSAEYAKDFIDELPHIQQMMFKDVEAGFFGDPAASSKGEIIISYPGLFAILVYRLAHVLYKQKVPILPRMMTEYAHGKTGIDINSGAEIGEYFFIDHGTGVVVGETTVIGNNVKLYQGVTLGALSTRKGQALSGVKRHPTIEDGVTIYSGASILGGDTVIGKGSIVAGNAFITKSIPPYTKVIVKTPELILEAPKQPTQSEKKVWDF